MPTAVRAPSLPRSWCRACVGGSFRCQALPGTTVLLVLRLGALHHTSGHPCVAACSLWHLSPGHLPGCRQMATGMAAALHAPRLVQKLPTRPAGLLHGAQG